MFFVRKNEKFPAGGSLILCSLLLFFVACSDEELAPAPDFGYAYFPLQIGQEREYRLDSIVYDPSSGMILGDSSSTFMREICTDTLRSAEGALLYRFEQFERKADSLPWKLQRVAFRSRNGFRAEYLENNLRFIPLVFPVETGRSWEGLEYIDPFREIEVAGELLQPFQNWRFEITNVGTDSLVAGRPWQEICAVEAGAENLIELRRWDAVYARDVGLVYQTWWILDSQNLSSDISWEEKAEKGYILRQYLLKP